MSGTESSDQNGGAIKEAVSVEYASIEAPRTEQPSPTDSIIKNIIGDISDTDTSENQKDLLEPGSQSALSAMNDNQEGKEKVNKVTNESKDTVAKVEQEETSSQSRELKSLLALSKEAKLDTNISRKRKVFSLRRKGKSDNRFGSGKASKIQYPVTAESELEMELHNAENQKMDIQEDDTSTIASNIKSVKRKKSILSDTSGESVIDETPKKNRKSFTSEMTMFRPDKDMFCWRCHKDSVNISCETCPRSYHQRCLKQIITDPDHWPCPECVSILKAESTQSRSPAMRGMTLEHLCSLLKFAVKRMIQCQGSEPFIHAVNDNEFPEYKKYIIQPMDLTLLEKNIKENLYGSTQAFEADAKWILHNSIIFNSYQSKLTSVARFIIKICKQEMAEIENCPSCYLNANTKKKTWFVEVCPKPHLLVWAKLRGFPFWPGKAMSCKDGMVDVRFFGAHDRAWVPEKECFLYSPKDPNLFRVKRADIEQCVQELEVHVENLKKVYGEFNYPPFKTPIDPDNEVKQLQIFLPKYKSYFNKNRLQKRQSLDKEKNETREVTLTEEAKTEKPEVKDPTQEDGNKDAKKSEHYNDVDETMEGYGTDDESMPEIDTEMRKTLLEKPDATPERDSHEADEDDTQAPTNTEPDTTGVETVVLSKEAVKRISGDNRAAAKKSDSEPSSKRASFDDSSPHPIKIIRRNSETKTEATRISDKINRVNISEDMEISLGNINKETVSCLENVSSSNSECSSDFSVEIKKKPIQVDVDNVEFTISPASKLKMAEKLMKRLSEGESNEESRLNKSEQVKCNFSETKTTFAEEAIVEPPPEVKDTVSSSHSDNEESLEENEAAQVECGDSLHDATQNAEKDSEETDEMASPNLDSTDRNIEEIINIPATKTADIEKSQTTTEEPSAQDASGTRKKVNWVIEESAVNSNTSKIILKAVRSEEQLDLLMKKSMEDEKNYTEKKSGETQGDSVKKTIETASREDDDDTTDSENSEDTPERELPPNKASSPKPVSEISSVPADKEIAQQSKDESDSLRPIEKDKTPAAEKEREKNVETRRASVKVYERDSRSENDEPMDSLDEVDLHIDKTKIINIIHSSLKETASVTKPAASDENVDLNESPPKTKVATRSNKRKKSIEFDESVLETQNKVLKLVSIESILNKTNNNQDENNANKENTSDTSILKTSLQAKKAPTIITPTNSTRSSIFEVSPEEIKSEPESEAESSNVRDLEAKKKYLSALNILEKGEADAQRPKPNEIRTRSKTEEKRERFRVSNEPQVVDNMTKIIEDVAVNYSAGHDGETLPMVKKAAVAAAAASVAKQDGGEIFVKSFAKIAPSETNNTVASLMPTKQRARKSFPQPNYNKPPNQIIKSSQQPAVTREQPPKVSVSTPMTLASTDSIPRLIPRTPIVTSSHITTMAPTLTPAHTPKATVPPLQQFEAMRPTNGYLILQSSQQDNVVFLPPNQSLNYNTTPVPSQVMSVTPCLVSAPTNTQSVRHLAPQPQLWSPNQNQIERDSLNVSDSQNYIPQGDPPRNSAVSNSVARNVMSNSSKKLPNGVPEPGLVSSSLEAPINGLGGPTTPTASSSADLPGEPPSATASEAPQPVESAVIAENGDGDEFAILNSLIPENVTRAVSEIIRRPPPKLKPRPPGMLSQQFCEGTPSSAGPVTAKINSVAHRLGDYFRGMLIETLEDLGKSNSQEATVANLKLEIENLKHRHNIEISEIEKNMCTVLKDIQRSIIEDRERIIEETRAACEAEAIKRVEEAKSKQWCANCSKEAQFYCCWNTSYCDYPCQQKHWPNHMNKCTQNVNQPAQITPSNAIRPGGQQLILRPANPPSKSGIGRVFSKPLQKVFMNRSMATPKTMRVQTSSGNLLTMMETAPGNYQLVTSSSLVRTGPSISNIKTTSLISVSSPGSTSIINSSSQQKVGTSSKQPIRVLNHPVPVTSVLEEDSE